MKDRQNSIPLSPYQSHDEKISNYNTAFEHLTPYSFSGFKKESISWKESCYLHAGLNPPSPYRLSGIDAVKLLKDTCVNTFEVFEIGSTRHAIMCNEQGNVMADGLVLHTAENEFICYFLNPYIDYFVDSRNYNVKGEDLSGKTFLFQLAGPRSLEVLECIIKSDIRSLKFFKHHKNQIKTSKHGDIDVRILRAGVAGTLAYEIHGDIENALSVYDALIEAGKSFGIERLGLQVYGMNHTENGFYQSFLHFMPAWLQDDNFMSYLEGSGDQILKNIYGSAGTDISKRYCNPIEVGWNDRVTFDHDFIGRKALENYLKEPKRKVVTLIWNEEDIMDIYASHFDKSKVSYDYMDLPANPIWNYLNSAVYSDDVFINERLVGISSGRIYSYYYRAMISLCLVDTAFGDIGNDLEVIWGAPGSRQKKIRVKVARFPFLDLPRNKSIDVGSF